jgi:D-3-phosphoglycerate dehydrogenase / 2-oxoglutarate reductase
MWAIENEALVRDLIRWVSTEPRPYVEVIEAWHTHCPRLPVWEDALEHRFVVRELSPDGELVVRASDEGIRYLTAG